MYHYNGINYLYQGGRILVCVCLCVCVCVCVCIHMLVIYLLHYSSGEFIQYYHCATAIPSFSLVLVLRCGMMLNKCISLSVIASLSLSLSLSLCVCVCVCVRARVCAIMVRDLFIMFVIVEANTTYGCLSPYT